MKVRHIPTAFRHDPLFVLRNGPKMLAHTFRGSTWRSMCGLESSREVLARYRAIRAEERKYLDLPDPAPMADEGPESDPCVSAIPLRA
jgi:hypothetical protein